MASTSHRTTTMIPQLLLIFLLLGAFEVHAKNITKGHTALYYFNATDDIHLTYNKKSIPLLQHPTQNKRIALIPINYRTQAGEKAVTLIRNGQKHTLGLIVSNGNYPSETLKVSRSKVHPNLAQQKRTAQEYQEAMDIYHTLTPKRYWDRPFIYPLNSAITSHYGTARLFNGSLRSYHSGTDFRAAVGTPIQATNDGVVVLAKARFYAGNSVLIDHGEGLYSCYYHLSRIDVRVGQTITQGETLGLSGKSGRVTGPHLHFAIMLQGVQVEPLQFLETINQLYSSPTTP